MLPLKMEFHARLQFGLFCLKNGTLIAFKLPGVLITKNTKDLIVRAITLILLFLFSCQAKPNNYSIPNTCNPHKGLSTPGGAYFFVGLQKKLLEAAKIERSLESVETLSDLDGLVAKTDGLLRGYIVFDNEMGKSVSLDLEGFNAIQKEIMSKGVCSNRSDYNKAFKSTLLLQDPSGGSEYCRNEFFGGEQAHLKYQECMKSVLVESWEEAYERIKSTVEKVRLQSFALSEKISQDLKSERTKADDEYVAHNDWLAMMKVDIEKKRAELESLRKKREQQEAVSDQVSSEFKLLESQLERERARNYDGQEGVSVSLAIICSVLISYDYSCDVRGKEGRAIFNADDSELPKLCSGIKDIASGNGVIFKSGELFILSNYEGDSFTCKM